MCRSKKDNKNYSMKVVMLLGVLLSFFSSLVTLKAQSVFPFPMWFKDNFYRPYISEEINQTTDYLTNKSQEGTLRLTESTVIHLVLESNLDVVVDRYEPNLSFYQIEVASRIFEPTVSLNLGVDRNDRPLSSTFLTGTDTQTRLGHTADAGLSKLFETGTQFRVDYLSGRVSDNNRRNFLNPYWQASVRTSISQPLLRNFGTLTNTRSVRIAHNNKDISESVFEQQVISMVNQVQSLYWDLVFANEDVKVKQQSLDLAIKTNEDNKKMAEIGTLAPIEVFKSEAEIARRRELLITAKYSLTQMEDQMKKLISSVRDPGTLLMRIEPLDLLASREDFKDFDLAQAVSYAIEQRPEIKQQRKRIDNAEIEVEYSRNQLLPDVRLNVFYGAAALEGVARSLPVDPITGFPVGGSSPVITNRTGVGDVFNRIFRSDFPNYGASFTVEIPLTNRGRQAEYARASVSRRQSEKRLKAIEQQVALEVRNAQNKLEMNRARIDATQKVRELAERNLDAEEKKFKLGTSQIRFVLEEQVRLAEAKTNEISALVNFTKSKRELDKAIGKTLAMYNINIQDAITGKIPQTPARDRNVNR